MPLRAKTPGWVNLAALALSVILVVALAGCGGGGGSDSTKPPSADEQAKLSDAVSTITDYCVAGIRSGSGPGNVGQLNAAVDDVISVYKAHKDSKAKFELIPGAGKQTIEQFVRRSQDLLGTGDCAPDQARRLEDAIAP